MAIPCEDRLPFEAAFVTDREIPIRFCAVAGQRQPDLEPACELEENRSVGLRFSAVDPSARLYMDGLELLHHAEVRTDETGECCLPPTGRLLMIYDEEKQDLCPLIPGYYRIRVLAGGSEYHALFKVKPKHLKEEEWERIKDELEAELRGLAQDLLRHRSGLADGSAHLPVPLLYRLLLLKEHFPKIMSALNDLQTRANFRLRKGHQSVPAGKGVRTDEQSLKHRAIRPQADRVLSVKNVLDYDLPENRWLRRFLDELSDSVREILGAIERNERALLEEIRETSRYEERQPSTQAENRKKAESIALLSEYKADCHKVKKGIESIRHAHWYGKVGRQPPAHMPMTLFYDPRYRIFYEIRRKLREETAFLDRSIASEYRGYWKRTDKLYEIWGFITVFRLLAGMGYVPESGWLFDGPQNSRMLVPTLEPGTCVTLRKGTVLLRLSYDQPLPRSAGKTDPERMPVHLPEASNRPDGRLDVHIDGTFVRSLLFDFKYRPMDKVWNHYADLAAKKQITDYLAGSSVHTFGEAFPSVLREQIRAVPQVWVLYPGRENVRPVLSYRDRRIKLIRLLPDDACRLIRRTSCKNGWMRRHNLLKRSNR